MRLYDHKEDPGKADRRRPGWRRLGFALVFGLLLLGVAGMAASCRQQGETPDSTAVVSTQVDVADRVIEAFLEKTAGGVTMDADIALSYTRHAGGLTNEGDADYHLDMICAGRGSHLIGTVKTNASGQEDQRPVELYAVYQGDRSSLYTLVNGGTGWVVEERTQKELEGIAPVRFFSAGYAWSVTGDNQRKTQVHGDDVLALIRSFPAGNEVNEIIAAMGEGDKDKLTLEITASFDEHDLGALTRLDCELQDGADAAFEGTSLAGTEISLALAYYNFAFGEADAALPEQVADGALAGDALDPYLPEDTQTGSESGEGESFVGGDGMSDTGDYEKKAQEINAEGSFILKSDNCEATVTLHCPEGMSAGFASDESVRFGSDDLQLSLNYGLYEKAFYEEQDIAAMITDWADYLEMSGEGKEIARSEPTVVNAAGREYRCITLDYRTDKNAVHTLYAWTAVGEDGWLVVQLQDLAAQGQIDAVQALEKYVR